MIKHFDNGLKRMAIVCCVWTFIFALPMLINSFLGGDLLTHQILAVFWMIMTCIGVLLSNRIVNWLYKD